MHGRAGKLEIAGDYRDDHRLNPAG